MSIGMARCNKNINKKSDVFEQICSDVLRTACASVSAGTNVVRMACSKGTYKCS